MRDFFLQEFPVIYGRKKRGDFFFMEKEGEGIYFTIFIYVYMCIHTHHLLILFLQKEKLSTFTNLEFKHLPFFFAVLGLKKYSC